MIMNNIIKSIQDYNSKINTENVEYSNNIIQVKDLISLYNLRLKIYKDKNAIYKDIDFLNKKVLAFNQLDSFQISKVKMVNACNYIFYFDQEYLKIYLVIDNLKKEVNNLLL